jgi:hypothetical protein
MKRARSTWKVDFESVQLQRYEMRLQPEKMQERV